MDQLSDIMIFSDMSRIELKKSIGNIKINSDLLELQAEYKKVKDGGNISQKVKHLKRQLKKKGSFEGSPVRIT